MGRRRSSSTAWRTGTALLTFTIVVTACGADSSDTTNRPESGDDAIRISVAVPATEEGMMNGTNWWADEITSRTDGRVEFQIFYADSLLPALEVLPGIRDGRVDAGWLSDPYWPAEFPLWQVVDIPFETSDPYAGARAFAELYEKNEAFKQEFHEAGVRPLHFLPYMPTMLGSSEPVENMESLSGKRFRAVGYIAEALSAVGAEPTAMAAGEMYESIQRGVLDGYAGFPMDVVTEFGLHEVAPYTVDMGVGHYASTAIGISLDVWDSLPSDIQEVITEVSAELQEHQAIKELESLIEPVCDRYEEAGADLSALSDVDVQRWSDIIGDDLREQWKSDAVERGVEEQVVEDFYDAYHDAYERHLSDSTWQDPVASCAGRIS